MAGMAAPFFVPHAASLPEGWEWLVGTPLQIVVVVLGALAVRWILHRAITRAVHAMETRSTTPEVVGEEGALSPARARLRAAAGLDDERRRQRAATMGSLLRSVTTVVVLAVATLTVAAQLGIQLGPLMASAGVAGVAVGFGAQSLVKDYLSGIFMIFEDQYGVGDVIDTGEAVGTVEEVTLRITRLRDANGVVWYVRNGEIIRVANRSQGWSTSLVDVPVSYDADIRKVTSVLDEVVDALWQDETWSAKLIERPDVAGVESVGGGAMTFRIIAKTAPNENFGVTRELRRRAVIALENAGVKAPPLVPGYVGVNPNLPPVK